MKKLVTAAIILLQSYIVFSQSFNDGLIEIDHISDTGKYCDGQYRKNTDYSKHLSDFNYDEFTISMKFKTEEQRNQWVFVLGAYHRLIGYQINEDNSISLTGNNQDITEKTATYIEQNKWYTATITYKNNVAVIFLDAQKIGEKEFTLSSKEGSVHTTNYSNGIAFKGHVKNMLVFNRALDISEVEKVVNINDFSSLSRYNEIIFGKYNYPLPTHPEGRKFDIENINYMLVWNFDKKSFGLEIRITRAIVQDRGAAPNELSFCKNIQLNNGNICAPYSSGTAGGYNVQYFKIDLNNIVENFILITKIVIEEKYSNQKSMKTFTPNCKINISEYLPIIAYNKAINGTIEDCNKYLHDYPSGEYQFEVSNYKDELIAYEKCNSNSMSDLNNYLVKYPNGKFVDNIKARIKSLEEKIEKEKKIEEERLAKIKLEQERDKKIQTNTNKALWKLGDKVCVEHNGGIICGTINQWNEDKSKCLIKVVSSPSGSYEGESLVKDNTFWIATSGKGWHLCLEDEIEKSLKNDNSSQKNNAPIDNTCPVCRGSGKCITCNGRGYMTYRCGFHDTDGDGYCTHCNNTGTEPCTDCWKTGACQSCKGTGRR